MDYGLRTTDNGQRTNNKEGKRFAIVVSDFNPEITSRLLEGATAVLKEAKVVHVPGTFEIPLAAKKLAASGKYDAIVALGCVIRGETVHFDVICKTTAASLQQISLETGVPITSGILMTENEAQAVARAGGEINRGKEAAQAALEIVNTLRQLGT